MSQSLQFILIFVWVMFAGIAGNTAGAHRSERVIGRTERRATWSYALLVMLPVVIMAGMRSMYFADTYQYVRSFLALPDTWYGTLDYIRDLQKDTGFYASTAVVHLLIGDRYRVYLMMIALVQGFCLMKTYRRYSEDYWLAIFIFVASTDIYSWMYNGMRQFVAAAIVFAAAGLLFRKKLIAFCIAVCFASLFHQSALLMIPVAFIVQGRAWNWKTLIVIFLTVLAITFVGTFTDLLGSALEDTQYSNVVSDWQAWEDDGTNPLRVLVYAMPTILSLFCRKKIQQSGDRVVHIACNMSIISTALYAISMVTSGIFIGRLPIYCSLVSNGILLPWELKHAFGKGMRTVTILCYAVFYFFQLRYGWGMI